MLKPQTASYIKDALTDIIMEEVTEDNSKPVVKLSVVGNSLGGLYARYAVRSLFLQGHLTLSKYNVQVEPATFATTASPWLGIASNTYLPLPRFMESAIGWTLSKTGKVRRCSYDEEHEEPSDELRMQY